MSTTGYSYIQPSMHQRLLIHYCHVIVYLYFNVSSSIQHLGVWSVAVLLRQQFEYYYWL